MLQETLNLETVYCLIMQQYNMEAFNGVLLVTKTLNGYQWLRNLKLPLSMAI